MKDKLRVLCFVLGVGAAMCFGHLCLAQGQAPQDAVYELHKVGENGVTAPKPIYHPEPEYTDRARKKKIMGTVLLSLFVNAEGTVQDAKVTTSLDKDLDNQALKTVRQWKFQPATKDGKPVAVRIAVEISFRIR